MIVEWPKAGLIRKKKKKKKKKKANNNLRYIDDVFRYTHTTYIFPIKHLSDGWKETMRENNTVATRQFFWGEKKKKRIITLDEYELEA